jgi:hypothetical protein
MAMQDPLYDKHHLEFEAWFTITHPSRKPTFTWQNGKYKENMTHGAWIAWLSLTGKDTATDTVESLAKETQRLNNAQLALTQRANKVLIPLANKLVEDGNLDELKSLVATFPSCSTRMSLAGKIALEESK